MEYGAQRPVSFSHPAQYVEEAGSESRTAGVVSIEAETRSYQKSMGAASEQVGSSTNASALGGRGSPGMRFMQHRAKKAGTPVGMLRAEMGLGVSSGLRSQTPQEGGGVGVVHQKRPRKGPRSQL